MDVALHMANFSWPGGAEAIARTIAGIGRTAEAAGVTHLSFMDHFFQIPPVGPHTEPMLEGYTALSFLAAHTSSVTLQLLCTGVTYRQPGVLAKTVTTLDLLSGGRAALGIGAAWFDKEHEGLGVPFPPVSERFERLEETVRICLQMWSEDNGPFAGTHYQLAETLCVPQPISAPRPPLMIAGGGEKKTLKLVARYADSCNLVGGPAEVAAKLDVLRGHCETEGRDYATITPTVMWGGDPFADPAKFRADVDGFAELGVGVLFLIPQGDPIAFAERVGTDIVPRLKQLP